MKRPASMNRSLRKDVSSALNLPLERNCLSDYSSGSFSNLRMAWVDAQRELTRRRRWWHRHYRLPLYLDALSTAFAAGRPARHEHGRYGRNQTSRMERAEAATAAT